MKKTVLALLLVSLLSPFLSTDAQSSSDYSAQMDLMRKYIDQDEGFRAINLVKPLLEKNPNDFDLHVLAAQAYADEDQPIMSLYQYRCALKLASNDGDLRVAYFGIGKIEFWLGHYIRAAQIYRILLCMHLEGEDKELALAGLTKSLAYANYNMEGYSYVPQCHIFTTPEMVIAASQASLWAGWPDITNSILCQNQAIVQKIDLNSPLGFDLQNLDWQTRLATAPNNWTPSFYQYWDSDGFIIRHYTLDYTKYWSQTWQSSAGVGELWYTQPGSALTYGPDFYLAQVWKPNRYLIFSGQVQPVELNNDWHPVLWNGSATYTPNDIISFNVSALREIVEGFPALTNRVDDESYAAGATLYPVPYLTLNGSASKTLFSDDNVRNGWYSSANLMVWNDFGLSTIGVVRGFTDSLQTGNYFSPSDYTAATGIVRVSRKVETTWDYYLDAGYGRQWIKPDPEDSLSWSPTSQYEGGIEGPITCWLIFHASYGWYREASAFINSPNYTYQQTNISFNFLIP